MSTGRHGKTVDRSELIEAVAKLAANNNTISGGGVAVEAIASELDFERSTIAPYCRQLAKSGNLKRAWGIDSAGPKLTYLPANNEDND